MGNVNLLSIRKAGFKKEKRGGHLSIDGQVLISSKRRGRQSAGFPVYRSK